MDHRRKQPQKRGPQFARVLMALVVAIVLPSWPRIAPAQSESDAEIAEIRARVVAAQSESDAEIRARVLAHRATMADVRAGCSAPKVVRLCNEARAYAQSGEVDIARELYTAAYRILPCPDTIFYMGLAELNSGYSLDALRHFRDYRDDPMADPAKLALVRTELLPKAFAKTGHLDVRSAFVHVPAVAAPSFADLAFYMGDDRVPVEDDGTIDVYPGIRTVFASGVDAGFEARVDVKASQVTAVSFRQVPPRENPSDLFKMRMK